MDGNILFHYTIWPLVKPVLDALDLPNAGEGSGSRLRRRVSVRKLDDELAEIAERPATTAARSLPDMGPAVAQDAPAPPPKPVVQAAPAAPPPKPAVQATPTPPPPKPAAAQEAPAKLKVNGSSEATTAPKPPVPPPAPAPAPTPAKEDDFLPIADIGPGFDKKLKDAGITNLAALAATTPEEIEAKTGIPANRVRQNKWIEQAAELAKTPKSKLGDNT
jgi:predicted flap endonuclease-1-like 5' DNA nuclease